MEFAASKFQTFLFISAPVLELCKIENYSIKQVQEITFKLNAEGKARLVVCVLFCTQMSGSCCGQIYGLAISSRH